MKIAKMSRAQLERATQWVIKKITGYFPSEERRKYAIEFNSRVLKIVNKHGDKGCTELDFVPFFKLEEMDLLIYTLYAMSARSLLVKETRFFPRGIK